MATLLDFKHWDKLFSSFGEKFASHINPVNGRLHAGFQLAGATRTGRMTSHSPSVHQLPREKDFRRLFVPGKGNVFVCDDYGQMQLRIAAELSGDARLLRAYELGEDVHRLNLDHRLLTAWCPKELRGLPVVVGDDSPELALASDLADRLRLEVGVEYVVADLSPLMRPLRVVVIEPERHDAVELAWREEEVVRAAGPTGPHPSRASSRLGSPVRLRSAVLVSVEVG